MPAHLAWRDADELALLIVLAPTALAYAVNAWPLRRLQSLIVAALARVQLGQPPRCSPGPSGVALVATAPRQRGSVPR